MTKYQVQIDGLVRDANETETAAIETAKAADEAQAEAKAERQVAREALLTKLGITEQEAQLLLGS